MVFGSVADHVHVISSRTRLTESPSSPESHAMVSGFTVLPENESGNHFLATAAAASARAVEGFMPATSAAAPATSLAAAPFKTPVTACTRLLPPRLSSHHVSALFASSLAQASTKA